MSQTSLPSLLAGRGTRVKPAHCPSQRHALEMTRLTNAITSFDGEARAFANF